MSQPYERNPNLGFLRQFYQQRRIRQMNGQKGMQRYIQKLSGVLEGFSQLLDKKMKVMQELISKGGKVTLDQRQTQQRFIEMKFPFQNMQGMDDKSRLEYIKTYSSDIARKIISKGFIYFEQGRFRQKNLRSFFCNNFLSNIVRFSYQNKLSQQQLQKMDQHLKSKVFRFLKQRYPQNESRQANRKFLSMITAVDNLDSNSNDLLTICKNVKFKYKKSGDYNKQIMLFINQILRITRDQKDQNGLNLFQQFYQIMESIFKKVEDQQWMVQAKQKNWYFVDYKSQQIIGAMFNMIQNQDRKPIDPQTQKKILQQQLRKQKYKKSVKQYTKYVIGQKISDNFTPFSKKQINQDNFAINNPGIMRIMSKWCQQLQKCFEQLSINSRDQRFKMMEFDDRYLKKIQRQQLFLEIERQSQRLKDFLQQVKKNNYQNQYHMLKEPEKLKFFRDHTSEDEAITGYFATIMKKSYQNYLISYLNKLLHCILEAQQNLKAKYNRKQHYKVAVDLITFKVGDLLRCKCESKQAEVIALYNYVKIFCEKNPNLLELVRCKNRLNQGTKDILINFKFKKLILVEMQLSINEESSHFIKCSDKANHFIYELQRATFGPIAQICNIYSNTDPRSEFFQKQIQNKNNKLSVIKKFQKCCNQFNEYQVTKNSLPIWCKQCQKFTSTLNISQYHITCNKCRFHRCSACIIRNKMSNMNIHVINNIKFSRKSRHRRVIVQDLEKKKKVQTQLFLISFNLKLMVFQTVDIKEPKVGMGNQDDRKELLLIAEVSKQEELDKLFLNKLIKQQRYLTDEQYKNKNVQITTQIIRNLMRNVRKKKRKFFIFQEEIKDDSVFLLKQHQKLDTVEQINMNNAKLTSIKALVEAFPNAKAVLIHKNQIKDLEGVSKWKNVTQLNLEGNKLSTVPDQIKLLQNLQFFLITNNKFEIFPNSICQIPNLKTLNFKQNKVKIINPDIKKMVTLQRLRMQKNYIEDIPKQIKHLVCLKQIDLESNLLKRLPIQINQLVHLQNITFANNQITQLNDEIFSKMNNLISINFNKNFIKKLPASLKGRLKLQQILIEENKLQKLPQFVFDLPSLTHLYVSLNQFNNFTVSNLRTVNKPLKSLQMQNTISQIPKQISQLKHIERLRVGGHKFINLQSIQNIQYLINMQQIIICSINLKKFPEVLLKLINIQVISLDDNQLETVPQGIIKLKSTLRSLYLSKNKFKTIPQPILKLQNLKNLGMNQNLLQTIPNELSSMRSLQRLKIEKNKIKSIPRNLIKKLHEIEVTKANLNQATKKDLVDKDINYKLRTIDSDQTEKKQKNR